MSRELTPHHFDQSLGVRQDLLTMSLPFFPDEDAGNAFKTTVAGTKVTIGNDRNGRMALPGDRKILNILSSVVAQQIRTGHVSSRHIVIDTRIVLSANSGSTPGGSDYARLDERLQRLMGTFIETEEVLDSGRLRKRRFRWIASYEHDRNPDTQTVNRLKISLSEEAYAWITQTLGFETPNEEFQTITARQSSTWRIYEVALSRLVMNQGRTVRIELSELRDRVPRTCPLKMFKSRILKKAMDAISECPLTSQKVSLSLEVRDETGATYTPLPPGKRCPDLGRLVLRVDPGPGPLPTPDILLPKPAARELHHQTA